MDTNDPTTWNVLVVDDDDSNRMVISHILEFYDAIVTVATSGKEALSLLNTAHAFNLILLDIQMPEVSGWMVLDAIRSAPNGLRTLPIIAITALAMAGDREKGLAAGFSGYLVKPLNPNTFIDNISQILAGLQPI
ncbi:MAG TPA: response regulator [Aggregatilineales bacterium]|nr:response regulator [Anaerolineales bacterium]HRE49544.1 response regulator [Aggregatilineales bacterium]